jgi:hypothetical protein
MTQLLKFPQPTTRDIKKPPRQSAGVEIYIFQFPLWRNDDEYAYYNHGGSQKILVRLESHSNTTNSVGNPTDLPYIMLKNPQKSSQLPIIVSSQSRFPPRHLRKCVHKFDPFSFRGYSYNERCIMRTASIREFRNQLPSLARQGDVVLVTNHGKMVGCFLPMEETSILPVELKREFVLSIGKKIARELAKKGVSEKDVMDDFEAFKKNRRR